MWRSLLLGPVACQANQHPLNTLSGVLVSSLNSFVRVLPSLCALFKSTATSSKPSLKKASSALRCHICYVMYMVDVCIVGLTHLPISSCPIAFEISHNGLQDKDTSNSSPTQTEATSGSMIEFRILTQLKLLFCFCSSETFASYFCFNYLETAETVVTE